MPVQIRGSVGRNGRNNRDDVRNVQTLLNQAGAAPRLVADGIVGAKTIAAIERFQQGFMQRPDGRVDPGGTTLQRLTGVRPATAGIQEDDKLAPWMLKAKAELGTEEIRGNQHNPRVVEYLRTTTNISARYQEQDETAWCSAFVNWVLLRSGVPGTNHALASSWLNWGSRLHGPQYGAITVVRKASGGADAATGSSSGNHVGFLVDAQGSRIRLLGGNQGGGVRVQYSWYNLGSYQVRGYRWPVGR
jgi:uncharacterized protein (TIGR02594 family)